MRTSISLKKKRKHIFLCNLFTVLSRPKAVILVLGALAATSTADLAYYNYPSYYSGYPWGSSFYRTQYHTQANYVPLAYSYAAPAVAYAAPAAAAPVAYSAPVVPYAAAYPVTNQYHSQNHLGEAAYGYSFPGQAHSAVRDAFGGVSG